MRLLSRLGRSPRPPGDAPASAKAEIEFVGYSGDCVVVGRLEVPPGTRLTDVLNAHEQFTIRDASLVSHENGRLVSLKEIVLERGEIYAVEARGERGEETRRISTRSGRVEMDLGPYLVLGTIHVRPGVEPIRALDAPRSMVPLTHATICYESDAIVRTHAVDTLIVNRSLVTRVGRARDEPGLPDMPETTTFVDSRAKEMTPEGSTRRDPRQP